MIKRRPPKEVMRLSRLGCFHQSRLSFLRVLLRRWIKEGWQLSRPDWQIDSHGYGHAVYRVKTPHNSYSLIAFAHEIADSSKRTDRVIADRWDASFTLFDGVPDARDIARLAKNVPRQEAGRISNKELTLSRANRSERMWDYVLDCLAQGKQPDAERLAQSSYLMRTTAVYGAGKFGAADHNQIARRAVMAAPFQAEMLSVYLIRSFVADLIEHCARAKNPMRAVALKPALRRRLGIGNSTGLGMAPFLINHPALFGTWIMAREEALARIRNIKIASDTQQAAFFDALDAAHENALRWDSTHPYQQAKLADLRDGLAQLAVKSRQLDMNAHPWDRLYRWAKANSTTEAQEQLVSVLLEPYGDLVDDLADCMALDETAHHRIDGRIRIGQCRALIAQNYGFALRDYQDKAQVARFWYVSANKLEPRLGERFDEEGATKEFPLDIARAVCAAYGDMDGLDDKQTLAEFLLQHPQHRYAMRRVQLNAKFPYCEIHDNLLHADMMPLDMLRCKLSFFGATKFDPRSDRWLRITLFNDLPYGDELGRIGDQRF